MGKLGIFDELFPENGVKDEVAREEIKAALIAAGFEQMDAMEPLMWFRKGEIEVHITVDGKAYSPTMGIVTAEEIKSL